MGALKLQYPFNFRESRSSASKTATTWCILVLCVFHSGNSLQFVPQWTTTDSTAGQFPVHSAVFVHHQTNWTDARIGNCCVALSLAHTPWREAQSFPVTPTTGAFCGGAVTLQSHLHGFLWTFCRGVNFLANSDFSGVLLGFLQHFTHGFLRTFCRGVKTFWSTLNTFCSGVTINTDKFGAGIFCGGKLQHCDILHGIFWTFCRGVSDQCCLLLLQFHSHGYFWTFCRGVKHSLISFRAFCSGAILLYTDELSKDISCGDIQQYSLSLHGIFWTFCRGVCVWEQLLQFQIQHGYSGTFCRGVKTAQFQAELHGFFRTFCRGVGAFCPLAQTQLQLHGHCKTFCRGVAGLVFHFQFAQSFPSGTGIACDKQQIATATPTTGAFCGGALIQQQVDSGGLLTHRGESPCGEVATPTSTVSSGGALSLRPPLLVDSGLCVVHTLLTALFASQFSAWSLLYNCAAYSFENRPDSATCGAAYSWIVLLHGYLWTFCRGVFDFASLDSQLATNICIWGFRWTEWIQWTWLQWDLQNFGLLWRQGLRLLWLTTARWYPVSGASPTGLAVTLHCALASLVHQIALLFLVLTVHCSIRTGLRTFVSVCSRGLSTLFFHLQVIAPFLHRVEVSHTRKGGFWNTDLIFEPFRHLFHFLHSGTALFLSAGWHSLVHLTWVLPRGDKSGPNSGHSRPCKLFLSLLLLASMTSQPAQHDFWSRGEGSGLPTETAEALSQWELALIRQMSAKPCGTQPQMSSGFQWSFQDKVKKRSLLRAMKRAHRDGTCWYKGKQYQLHALSKMTGIPVDSPQIVPSPASKPPHHSTQMACNRKHQNSRFLRYCSWNCGGLSSHKLDEVKHWGLCQNLDAMILTETRWRFCSEWQDGNWMFIHSGHASQPGAGILILLSRRLCTHSSVRWLDVSPGRRVHVQIRLMPRCFDLVAGYQHTFSTSKTKLTERASWWTCLDQYLDHLPKRHVLLLAGDFNCRLPALRGHVGMLEYAGDTTRSGGSPHTDEGQFLALVKTHNLVALNTWRYDLGPTFKGINGSSRIDFSFTRYPLADGCAKDVQYVSQAPFLDAPHYGHIPMVGQLRKFWIPPKADQTTAGISISQREAGRLAYVREAPEWTQFMHDSAGLIEQHLTQADPRDSDFIPKLHRIASKTFTACFPDSQTQPVMSSDDPGLPLILNKWRHRDMGLRSGLPSQRNVLQCWFHLARFQALKRLHKKHAYWMRQQRFETVLAQAQIAAEQHDSFQLFKVINRLAPKTSKRRLLLRNRAGNIATPGEEAAMLQSFVAQTWSGPSTVPKPSVAPVGLPFSMDELLSALSSIPISKAVARPFSPGFIWHAHAHLLTPHLYRILEQLWNCPTPVVPSCWRDAWLLLIPKPMKKPCKPEALRPLALQEPIGKSVVGLLAQVAQRGSFMQMVQWPLWAYLPGRSTQHALNRVIAHCTAGRRLVASQRPAVMTRHMNMPMYTVCGAIQLLMDLSKAFDSVCRQELFGRLDEVLDNPKVIQMLAIWHEHTAYHVTSSCGTDPIPVGAGVRQGCKAAPWLFNAFVLLYLKDLSHLIDWAWLQRSMNIYADDIHACSLFYSLSDLQRILYFFGLIMEVLQAKGMHINTTKSAVLLTLGGTNHRHVRSTLTRRASDGEWIKIKGRHHAFELPIVKQTKYLGVIVSYAAFEDATTRYRLSLARLAYARLKKWLTARRGFQTKARLRLWSTCVLPILTYGLFTVGLTKQGLQLLSTAMITMLRQIHHDHAYATGRSHLQALDHHRLDPPLVWLWHAADVLYKSVTKPKLHLIPNDLSDQVDWNPLLQTHDFIRHAHESGLVGPGVTMSHDEVALTCTLTCPCCSFTAPSLPVLRRHMTSMHQLRRYRHHVPHLHRFMTHGLPTCYMCHGTFTTWRQFTIHIQRGCQVDALEQRMPRPLAPFPDLAAPAPTMPTGTPSMLTKAEIESLRQREFGPRLLTLIHHKRWPDLMRPCKLRVPCTTLHVVRTVCG